MEPDAKLGKVIIEDDARHVKCYGCLGNADPSVKANRWDMLPVLDTDGKEIGVADLVYTIRKLWIEAFIDRNTPVGFEIENKIRHYYLEHTLHHGHPALKVSGRVLPGALPLEKVE